MLRFLGSERRRMAARFLRVDASDASLAEAPGDITWYDAREAHPTRSEFRLYFSGNAVMDSARVGDILVVALLAGGNAVVLLVSEASDDLADILWLFGVADIPGAQFEAPAEEPTEPRSIAVCSQIADRLGLDLRIGEDCTEDWVGFLVERFGESYPPTREFSSAARETVLDVDPRADPDEVLVRWMDREEQMFRQFERYLLARELPRRAGRWVRDVDDFVSYSLSVQNRRKSRAGLAFENHVESLLNANEVGFDRGSNTENRSRPDFLFPGSAEYLQDEFPDSGLFMLGVKTTCKDRWRQVLNEAARIPTKHLLTLDPAVTSEQLAEMQRSGICLILPAPIARGYSNDVGRLSMTMQGFISLVKDLPRLGNHDLF